MLEGIVQNLAVLHTAFHLSLKRKQISLLTKMLDYCCKMTRLNHNSSYQNLDNKPQDSVSSLLGSWML